MSTKTLAIPGWKGWTYSLTDSGLAVNWPDDTVLNAGVMRSLPWGDLVRARKGSDEVYQRVTEGLPRFRKLSGSEPDPMFDDLLLKLYRRAALNYLNPADTFSWHFRISSRTAERWLVDARKRGVIKSLATERAIAQKEAEADDE